MGVHPTRCDEFEAWEGGAEDYLQQLLALALPEGKPHPKIVAVGEFGLGTRSAIDVRRACFLTLRELSP